MSSSLCFRYFFVIEYNGQNFSGWQFQKGAISVQEMLQRAMAQLTGEEVFFQGAGRTDRGVHARGQVAHCDLSKPWPLDSLRRGMNFYLKNIPISILAVKEVPLSFHARFSALFRRYEYKILHRPSPPALELDTYWWISHRLDEEAMALASSLFQGHHDFHRFRYKHCQSLSSLKTLDFFSLHKEKEECIVITVQARSFLHRQVRMMVGAIVQVGRGKTSITSLQEALTSPYTSTYVPPTAPSQGLYLSCVGYPSEEGSMDP